MIGHNRPSEIVNDIYDIMADYETEGLDFYHCSVIDAITDYLNTCLITDKYQLCCANWPLGMGGCCALSIIENGYPFLIMFNYGY